MIKSFEIVTCISIWSLCSFCHPRHGCLLWHWHII